MRKKRMWKGLERRASERICDDSILNVRGKTHNGNPFLEIAAINDVSSDGISFYLEAEVGLQSILEVEICSTENSGEVPYPLFSGKIRVLRVTADGQDGLPFLVAASFLEPLSQLRELGGTEEFANDLRRAIELDEEARRALTERS